MTQKRLNHASFLLSRAFVTGWVLSLLVLYLDAASLWVLRPASGDGKLQATSTCNSADLEASKFYRWPDFYTKLALAGGEQNIFCVSIMQSILCTAAGRQCSLPTNYVQIRLPSVIRYGTILIPGNGSAFMFGREYGHSGGTSWLYNLCA